MHWVGGQSVLAQFRRLLGLLTSRHEHKEQTLVDRIRHLLNRDSHVSLSKQLVGCLTLAPSGVPDPRINTCFFIGYILSSAPRAG